MATSGYLDLAATAGVYLEHLRTAEAEALSERLLAVRAQAQGHTDAAAAAIKRAEDIGQGVMALMAQAPADVLAYLAAVRSEVVNASTVQAAAAQAQAVTDA